MGVKPGNYLVILFTIYQCRQIENEFLSAYKCSTCQGNNQGDMLS